MNYNLQQLIERGYVKTIVTTDTHLGSAYDLEVELGNSAIDSITIHVGIDDTLDDAILLINLAVEAFDKIGGMQESRVERIIREHKEAGELEDEE